MGIMPPIWRETAARYVAKGLKKCPGRSFRFPNFIRTQLLVEIINHESFDSEFAQAAFLSSPSSECVRRRSI